MNTIPGASNGFAGPGAPLSARTRTVHNPLSVMRTTADEPDVLVAAVGVDTTRWPGVGDDPA